MNWEAQYDFDVLVIGGGPAGMASAARAAECGARVGIVDDNLQLGGQIWRGHTQGEQDSKASMWIDRVRVSGVTLLCGFRAVHQPEAGVLQAENSERSIHIAYKKLILATGAREKFLSFPGWTLPNIMGAGGLQAMVKGGLPIRGKRVVVAGTGPLLLAVAAHLRKLGAEVPVICEQASWKNLARFGLALTGWPAKIAQGIQLKRELGRIPFAASSWVVSAHGEQVLESVTISRDGKSETIPCDYLACGFHLVPNIELPLLLGCRIHDGGVQVDDFQQTTVAGVFCAGEPTSVGGVELALIEGQIAGHAAAGRVSEARILFSKRAKARRFALLLDRTFALRPELANLARPETIVCRCEDVSYSRLQQQTSWRAAKLYTRCGMGACQGRVCGPTTQFLFKWEPESVRPPVFPARIETLGARAIKFQLQHNEITGGNG